jgi:glycosyltransferase involved in cell wall biosynthesis
MPSAHPQANAPFPYLAVTGAALYIKRAVIDGIGYLDEGYGMAYEDVDYCLRAWEAGFQVLYYPYASLTHLEAKTRGMEQGQRELDSQQRFWERWGDMLEHRRVHTDDGRLRIIYVTEDTGVGGGHRVVFQHLSGLAARGHDCQLWSLTGPPDWFDLDVPVRSFVDYDELAADLARRDGFKVATWWQTAAPVWLGSVQRGIPVYFVQDIESSYYPDDQRSRDKVMASYREEFHYMTTSGWNRERLAELNLEAVRVPCGVDRGTYRPLAGVARRDDVLLAAGRSHQLKNLELTIAAWRRMSEPRPELWLYGAEPELGEKYGARYLERPSDDGVNELLNQATAFVQTSRHEGFCLPALEAMAAGTPVIVTDAHGNRDYCADSRNCLVPAATPDAVAAALDRVFRDPTLRDHLARAGVETAAAYDRAASGERLERFFTSIEERHGEPRPRPRRARAVHVGQDARAAARTARARTARHGARA